MLLSMTRRMLSVLLLLGLFTCVVKAQTTTSGALAGVVTDQSGAAVPDAEIGISDKTKGAFRSTKTNREGSFQFPFLAPGIYTLRVTHSSFREEQQTVNVLLGPAVSVNVTLAIAGTKSEAIVTDEVSFLQAENGDASSTMNQSQISEVPNPGNDLTYIVQATPGVVMNTDVPNSSGMNFSILGMPSTSYRFSIDGVDNPPIGALGLLLGQNQIQEATVVSTGYSSQFGNAAGGNINYLTKSGSNQFHGNAQYYWNGSVLNANDWFNNAFGNSRPFDIANQWAGSFGGPLKKNKLFFFSDIEGLRILVPQLAQLLIPTPEFERATITNIDRRFGAMSQSHAFYQKLFNLYNAAPGASSTAQGSFTPGDLGCAGRLVSILPEGVPCVLHTLVARGTPGQDALKAVRVDWNLIESDRLFLHVQQDAGKQTIFANAVSSLFDQNAKTNWWEGQAVETHIFSPSAASQLVIAYSNLHNFSGVDDLAKTLDAFPTQVFFPPPEQFNDMGGSSSRNFVTQFQISDDLMESGRRHKLGAGFNFVRIHSTKSFSPDVGLLIPNTLDAFYQGGADPDFADTDFTTAAKSFRSILSEPTVSYRLGIYGQDEWHPRPDLSTTIALRAEYGSNLACETRCFARLAGPFNAVTHDPSQPYNQVILASQKQAFPMPDTLLWSPRFSFAWQPFGVKRNIVLRGGIGFFYDSVESIAANFAGNPPQVNSFTETAMFWLLMSWAACSRGQPLPMRHSSIPSGRVTRCRKFKLQFRTFSSGNDDF